jgi:hypothetical protein
VLVSRRDAAKFNSKGIGRCVMYNFTMQRKSIFLIDK